MPSNPHHELADNTSNRQPIITDNPEHQLIEWLQSGEQVALVTLIKIEGAAPRHVGAQMVVTRSGKAAGYISGGCLENALVDEAVDAITTKTNKRLRYGQDSPFLDFKLPCESGLEFFINQNISTPLIVQMAGHIQKRSPFLLKTNLEDGSATIFPALKTEPKLKNGLRGQVFDKIYIPQTRLLLFGSGPTYERLVALAPETGFALESYSTTSEQVGSAVTHHHLRTPKSIPTIETDPWTAAILAFHDHEWEIPILSQLLKTDCFYIGAIGNRKVAKDRTAALKDIGFTDKECERLTNSAGLLKGAKEANSLALGILSEILANRPT